MGYYSDIRIEGRVAKVEELRREIERIRNLTPRPDGTTDPKDKLIQDWFVGMIEEVNDNGYIMLSDYNAKWYHTEEVITWIAPYMADNTDFIYTGEDTEQWGYRIIGGIVYQLEFTVRCGEPLILT